MRAGSQSVVGLGAVAGALALGAGVVRGLGTGAGLAIDDIGTSLLVAGAVEGLVAAAAIALVAALPDSDLTAGQRKVALGVAAVVLLLGPFAPGIVPLGATALAIGWFYGDRAVQRLPPDAAMSQRLRFAFGSLGTMLAVALLPALLLLLLGTLTTTAMARDVTILAFGALIVANVVMRVGFRRTRADYLAAAR